MKRILSVLFVLLLLFTATGCNDMAIKNYLVGGTYMPLGDYYVTLEFHRDGTVTVEDGEYNCVGDFEWRVNGDHLVIGDYKFEYEIVGDYLLTLEYEGYRINFMCVY